MTDLPITKGVYIHDEPECDTRNGCETIDPHRHGFNCTRNCVECRACCHPYCPVSENLRKRNIEYFKNTPPKR